jgi:hypothetical protein
MVQSDFEVVGDVYPRNDGMVAQANLLRSRQFYMTVALLGQVKLLPSLNFKLLARSRRPVNRPGVATMSCWRIEPAQALEQTVQCTV